MNDPRVLIVEDDPKLRGVLMEMARACGFKADGVGSAEVALRRVQEEDWPILLVDLHLPQADGLSLIEQMNGRPGQSPQCVVLTGFGNLATAQQAIRHGVADFLTKPCRLAELEQALGRAWQRHNPRQVPPAEPVSPSPAPGTPMAEVERAHILAALDRHQGNRKAAAQDLGISLRKLYYRLKTYDAEGHA